jgi:hypothetical protein
MRKSAEEIQDEIHANAEGARDAKASLQKKLEAFLAKEWNADFAFEGLENSQAIECAASDMLDALIDNGHINYSDFIDEGRLVENDCHWSQHNHNY